MRICTACGEVKEWSEFNKSIKGVNGHAEICRECRKIRAAEYRSRENTKKKNYEYHRSDNYKRRARERGWSGEVGVRAVNREIKRREDKYVASFKYISRDEAYEFSLPRYFEGAECKWGHISERQTANAMCLQCARDRWNSDDSNKKSREYYAKNKVSLLESSKKSYRERYKNNPEFKAATAARNMLKRAISLTGSQKRCSTFIEIGYEKEELMMHLESKFENWMTWDNFGDWHIDHIVPVSHLVKSGITSPKAINCLDNLSPISREENMNKRCKLPQSALYDKIMKKIEEINNEANSN